MHSGADKEFKFTKNKTKSIIYKHKTIYSSPEAKHLNFSII